MTKITSDEDVLRPYLLGRLAPESREGVEKRLLSDDRIFWEHLCLAEEELIDDYVREDLDDDERGDFERHFLQTDDRRGKLEFARALQAYAVRQRPVPQGIWRWLRSPIVAPGWALATAATLLLVLPGVVWRFTASSGPRDEVSVSLSPGTVRDAGGELKRVRIPSGCQLVHIELDPGTEEYAGYRATLHEVAGDEIWSQNKLTADARGGREAVTLTLPSELLADGDYYVRLHGLSPGTDPVLLHRYDVRVLR